MVVFAIGIWKMPKMEGEHRCTAFRGAHYDYPKNIKEQIAERQGGVFDPYSMHCYSDIKGLAVSPVVNMVEAHDSGLCGASVDERMDFAHDLDNLVLADPFTDRWTKGGKDAGEWLPRYNRCWYVATVVDIKRRHGISFDKTELASISDVLSNCSTDEISVPSCAVPKPARKEWTRP